MKRLFITSLILLVLVLGNLITIAQDEDMSDFDFESSDASISFPSDWETEVDENGVLMLSTDGVEMMVFDAAIIADVLEVEEAETAEDLLASVIDVLPGGLELNADDAKTVELGERDVLRLAFEEGDEAGMVIVVPLSDETFGLVMVVMASDADEDMTTMVDDIVASFDIAESTASGEACTVSTLSSGTVQVRVGPGTNRTVIAFLPANISFAAQGQTTDDDGNVWFRVPQGEVAPNKAVNETWVAAADVDQSGDCENVVDAAAPPIIPIRQQQPTAVPQQSTDTTTTDTTTTTTTTETTSDEPAVDPFATDANGAFILSQGQWLEKRNNGSIRCNIGSGVATPAQGTIIDTLTGGSSAGITFNGQFYDYLGNNTYETTYFLEVNGGELLIRETITFTSANTGSGSLGGVAGDCTAFLPLTINYIGG